jgi:hypothetical protein
MPSGCFRVERVAGRASHAQVFDWVRGHADAGSDLAVLSREELRQMAADLSLAETDLRSLARGRDNSVLMGRMMRAHGLDADRVRHTYVTLMRDVERVCTQCKSAGKCRRELDAGTALVHCREYCPNAATFDDLVDSAEVPTFP